MLNIIKKRFSKVVIIVKLSYDMFYLVSGPFLLLKNTHFAKLDKNAISGIVRKVYIIGKIPFLGIATNILVEK